MASLWIIDGFNLLRQSKDLAELEAFSYEKARKVLTDRLKLFSQVSGEEILCVFDATGSVETHRKEEPHGRVKLIYTKGGELADELITQLSKQKKEACIVVSSDREIIEAAEKSGSSTLSSQDFDRLLLKLQSDPYDREEDEEGFDPKHGTQKKGPAHRRAKKDRKVFSKIKKFL